MTVRWHSATRPVGETELLARGRRDRKTGEVRVDIEAGASVSTEQREFWTNQLLKRRRTILNLFNPELELEPSFIEELTVRGYDLSTFRFSISLRAPQNVFPRLRVPRQRPGVLHASWACLPYDRTGDLVCSWHRPCTKRDSNMFHSFFSMPVYQDHETRRDANFDRSLLKELEKQGFDIRTFHFQVRHATPPTDD